MSGTCSIDQYIDKDDPLKRWVAEVTYHCEKVQTFQLDSEESALIECYKWAKRLGWQIDDTPFWYELQQLHPSEAKRLYNILKPFLPKECQRE